MSGGFRMAYLEKYILEIAEANSGGRGGRAPPFFAVTCFFAIALKNYTLRYSKLN